MSETGISHCFVPYLQSRIKVGEVSWLDPEYAAQLSILTQNPLESVCTAELVENVRS
jgi:hypothetical protein